MGEERDKLMRRHGKNPIRGGKSTGAAAANLLKALEAEKKGGEEETEAPAEDAEEAPPAP